MQSREEILGKIRNAHQNAPKFEVPQVPVVRATRGASTQEMLSTFEQELNALSGRFFHARSLSEARNIVSSLIDDLGWCDFSAVEHPLLREIFPPETLERFYFGEETAGGALDEKTLREKTDKRRLSRLSAGVVFPRFLIAETGTVALFNESTHERLNCYLPPACLAVGKTSQLREHLPAVWGEIAREARDANARGEWLLVTGPSRTADIEKVTILGVHGPKVLCVLVIDDNSEDSSVAR
ncbi:MAG: LUD domain-containing protein [Planctomycetia bacterium]|nr:LUD domain-containing protein [Planctomycetia bacterium]